MAGPFGGPGVPATTIESGAERPILILTGPTGVGKTALSIALAERLNAEIISADSRQVYRELNVGTAKPDAEQLARVRHHFIDELSLHEPFSAGIFAEAAQERIRQIRSRGKAPLVVGGSTLYIQALQFGLADVPEVDPDVRARIEARLEAEGAPALFAELELVDPAAAASMDATKSQRLVRALEVYHGTGAPLSSYFGLNAGPTFSYRTVVLCRDRAALYERINRRVDEMVQAGLVEEVRRLLGRYDPSLNPLQSIGYQEPIRYLQGEVDEAEMIRLIKRNTRRYAKRQLTWFRRFPAYEWIDIDTTLQEAIMRRLTL